MARLAKTAVNPTGLYAWLLEREEEKVRRFAYNDGTQFPYPRWRVEALRAGQPVDVPTHVLPKWAGTPGMSGRAVVYADDRIEPYAADIGRWMDDNGLLFDETQGELRARREYDMFDMSWKPFTWIPRRGCVTATEYVA